MPEIDAPLLTIFSRPGCVQCKAAERHAEAKNIPFQKIDVTETPEALELVTKEWGYMSAPVLYFDGEHVHGFDPNFMQDVQNKLQLAA